MNYLRGSFIFSLFFVTVTAYFFYALDRINTWQVTPGYFLFVFLLISIFLLKMAFKKKNVQTIPQKLLISLTILLNLFVTIVLCIYLFFFLLFPRSFDLIETQTSPNEKIQLNFYSFDAGGMGTFGIIGEVNGPLWFKKRIYYETHVEDVHIEWIDNDTLFINKVLVEL